MRNNLALIVLFVVCSFTFSTAQSTTPTVVASQGDYYTAAGGSVSWTLGEIVTETESSSGHIITQGFHQPKRGVGTGITAPMSGATVALYPNPVTDFLSLDFSNSFNGNYRVEIFDMHGKKLFTENFSLLAASNKQHNISFSDCADGIYLLNIINPENNFKQSYKINKAK